MDSVDIFDIGINLVTMEGEEEQINPVFGNAQEGVQAEGAHTNTPVSTGGLPDRLDPVGKQDSPTPQTETTSDQMEKNTNSNQITVDDKVDEQRPVLKPLAANDIGKDPITVPDVSQTAIEDQMPVVSQIANNMTKENTDQGANDSQGGGDLAAKERGHYAHLCRLLLEGGAHALRQVFNSIHPSVSLATRLAKPEVMKNLRRLKSSGILTQPQWEVIYPEYRRGVTSEHFDTPLLMILLKHICHMSPPYPNGWNGAPLPGDISISADVARVPYFRKQLAAKTSISSADYEAFWSQIGEILVRLGGAPIKVKLDRLARDKMLNNQQTTWINELKVRTFMIFLCFTNSSVVGEYPVDIKFQEGFSLSLFCKLHVYRELIIGLAYRHHKLESMAIPPVTFLERPWVVLSKNITNLLDKTESYFSSE